MRRFVVAIACAALGIATALIFVPVCSRIVLHQPPGDLDGPEITRVADQELDASGLSGLTRDGRGQLWSVAERGGVLVAGLRRPEPAAPSSPRIIPVSGIPDDVELEAITWLGRSGAGQHFAIGTEGVCAGQLGQVLMVEVTGDPFDSSASASAHVREVIDVPLSLWGAECDARRGIEAICHAAGQLMVGFEVPDRDDDGRRLARLARIDLSAQPRTITPLQLILTSDEGKLSSLDCWSASGQGDAIEMIAIERHYRVSRLIRATAPARGPVAAPLSATVVRDLGLVTEDGLRNFEGLVQLAVGQVVLVTDNQRRRVRGPSEVIEVDLP
ncbi:MAG: hypothetical protein AAGC55_31085 [Myxococcota bacterium]